MTTTASEVAAGAAAAAAAGLLQPSKQRWRVMQIISIITLHATEPLFATNCDVIAPFSMKKKWGAGGTEGFTPSQRVSLHAQPTCIAAQGGLPRHMKWYPHGGGYGVIE